MGEWLAAIAGVPLPPLRTTQVGGVAITVVIGLATVPLLVVPGALAAWGLPLVGHRRRKRSAAQALVRELPDVIDLFALAFGSGLTVTLAVEAVSRHSHGCLGAALAKGHGRTGVGVRLSDALLDIADDLGDPVRPLLRLLVDADHAGVDPASAIDQVAAEARAERRRQAESAARRVPVRLLFPLVVCVLPAFTLLTVVPVVAATFRSLAT